MSRDDLEKLTKEELVELVLKLQRPATSSLYGITSLAVSRKLPDTVTPEDMAASLVANYINGLRSQRQEGSPRPG